ncbi:tRNA (N(6)-L-threonylcarbamoyladenosine(37)-C(2))-methylthiotransferase MtaB [Mediterraneibacter gnavus]|jgi:threonylcarbamoyladenosine tRNA methylthiotransferase MtaB|uniref:Threonylcarbamoyladenosine tRNA methylthiotransferase MtaB n=1 Tax=Mediterraneibacter gnavus TaxID=33038 RepID=A0AAJ1EW80_MEDGN|nr:tRNA (N(6)-L-threonylcarbamoyladenosine(37)-C(2))-methylthiotransferase MtaB [Mediterraneibacter gnavus]MCB5620298.1 tRNA (N(6)-L-threonylcarbamoyladenosine(37)-C(2))-methylthiotransferase MtaB [Mediterraneibacter gnavus]MCB5665567.1 tRNA (N(6)-L-threonylcarbamoyladenosine(37)-C(2))-methylthiotransferase MtaB [Mediterraneibacter gnavus]MCB5682613.1 tRNA (N(6)-L-threonylcarbamoyladenosine(37)-C(2))-methylthiotransferase MtaB [Mediterraneibacter gnavus]NSH69623.1 tRNA (N(6)-L-threonylcarbamoyl
MKKVALHNLGCKVNAYETEAMQEMLEHAGYEIVPFQEGADIYVINTCTVTNIADRKSRQMLHRARKMNPDAVVVAAGCYVQAQAEKQVIDPCIDIVLGNNKKQDLLTALQAYEEAHGDLRKVIDINHTKEYENLHLTKQGEHTRAYIKVQDGCNQFCSYCIIPYARGRVRSRAKEDVVAEVTDLAKNGYQEVVLTGIHLSSYGIDFENEDNLLSLIRAVHEIEGIKRIRLGSLEPRIITEEFVQAIAALPKMCPHFHLSLQSGCNETLKRMNRRYTSEEFYEKCEILRKYFEKPALTTDVIVGFPQETEEEFETTYEFLKKICFYETHIFKYSKREGTKAAVMQGQIPEQIKAKRSARLIELGEKSRRAYEESFLGKTVEVLVEEKSDVNGKEMWTGHTKEYMKIALESEKNLQNCILNVQIKDGREIIH